MMFGLSISLDNLRRYLGLSLVSASVLALQVIFTRIFSIMIWHHFTYLVIGVALLGGGAAGTYLAIRQWETPTLARRIGRLAIGFSISIVLDLLVITSVRFDPLRMNQLPQTLVGLVIYFAALFTTFFLGGLTIVSAFRLWTHETHRLYFADLLGAGISMLAVIWMISGLGGPGALVFIALLALLAAALFGGHAHYPWKLALLVTAVGQISLLIYTVLRPIQLPVPQSKSLEWALRFAGVSAPEYTRWNPVARVDVVPPVIVDEPMIVGGVSSVYLKQNRDELRQYELRLVTLDGTSMTGLYKFNGDLAPFEFLRHSIISAPYEVSVEHPTTLSIGVGGGLDILLAMLYGANRITAIDLNADVVKLLDHQYADYAGRLAEDPRTTVMTAEGRSFLMRDQSQYDIIQGIGLDNIAALSSGAYVLAEAYLYTVEALELAIDRLTPQGIFSWTRNTSSPPSETLRLTGMAAEALRRRGITSPAQHIVVVENEAATTITLLVSRAPFTLPAIQRLRDWAAANGFHLLHDPFERLQTPYADYLLAPEPRVYEASYVFDISPATDDHPFYYNYYKWSNFYFSRGGQVSASARFPVGNLILLTLLVCAAVTAVLFILLPLARYKRSGLQTPHTIPMLIYFSALGLGYIFVEIVLIQRFTLFIGYPTRAITTTIFSLLSFSAVGSLLAQRICRSSSHLRAILLILAGLILLYTVGLPPVFEALLQLPDGVRTVVSILLIAPLAFVMGMPFPTGLSRLGLQAPGFIPWAWGMNGVFSVLGSALVVLVGMLSSFTVALVSAALFYGLASVVAVALWKTHVADVVSAVQVRAAR